MPTTDKIFEVATDFYDELFKLSEQEDIDGQTFNVYRGSMSPVWKRVSNSQSYYVPVMSLLRDRGYMSVLQRGTRGRPTVIAFHARPQREEIDELTLTGASTLATMQAEIESVVERLGGMDIVKAFENHERRILKLEEDAADKKERVNGKTKKAKP